MNNLSGQPYIYAPPSRYSGHDPYGGFDPKAFTRASFIPPKPKPKPTGPLIDFNKHPDSYLIRPYGQTTYTPMSPNTKKKVERLRYTQQGLRVIELIGAIGMLMCVIFVRNTSESQGPIIRIPPAFDIVISGYAIWHLLRSAKSRPPGSSASYHFFAMVMDGGLIPFYVFIALVTRSTIALPATDTDRWTSIFTDQDATDKVLVATWLGSAIVGGLHVVCLLLSLWLCLIFREIANLPPDMNPLEDNLTARPSRKHKYKNSEATASTISERKIDTSVTASVASLAKSEQPSHSKQMMMASSRPISFLHTRTKSQDEQLYSPHNPRTANASRISVGLPALSMYQQPESALGSNVDLASTASSNLQRSGTIISAASENHLSTISSRSISQETTPDAHLPPVPRKSSKRNPSESDNWKVYNDENVYASRSTISEDSHQTGDIGMQDNNFLSVRNAVSSLGRPRSYEPVSQLPTLEDRSRSMRQYDPLGMNPPTPRTSTPNTRPLSEASGNGSPSSNKKKYYGDLDSAFSAIRHGGTPQKDAPYNAAGSWRSNYIRQQQSTSDAPNWMPIGDQRRHNDGNGRVISRSGAQLNDHPLNDYMEDVPLGNEGLRGRNVSGKVAEEGRGGALGGVWWRI